ncbi:MULTISPECIES: hypothetical protein [Streptomyces]|uniref:Uncharacterized protein n=1 Tax=Streptomyces eurythermus TaxID=42237 RepID=A0ABW6Z5L1_9ACTN|nr:MULTISPECIES: hypothetical protein [Streptomyces]QIS75003.1 hypothetical protein HB370_37700 [Streptomyces sp. DSM 40868]
MTPSFDRKGGKLSVPARAKEASSRLRDVVCSICLTDQVALVAQTFGVVLSLQEPPASSEDHITAVLSLITHGYQLYRTLKES